MNPQEELKYKLQKIKKVFDVDKILSANIDQKSINTYYKVNKLPYSLFHTNSHRMHMGISRNNVYKKDDLLEVERVVQKYIGNLHATHVLELATGRGATSAYLAERNPQITFDSIDVSADQLNFALKKAKMIPNYHPTLGDFHNLEQFSKNYFDIVFIVEALCHSKKKQKVLSEAQKILKGGVCHF